jgi:hypothetical protein
MTQALFAPAAAAAAIAADPSGPVPEPTLQQAARFSHQLQLPTSATTNYYQAAPPDPVEISGNWRVMMHDVGQIAAQLRADAATLDHATDNPESARHEPSEQPDLRTAAGDFRAGMAQLAHMSYTMLNVSLITTTERLAGENVRSLYQLG